MTLATPMFPPRLHVVGPARCAALAEEDTDRVADLLARSSRWR